MPKTYAVYYGKNAKKNVDKGLADLVWGWKDDALDEAGGRTTAQAMQPGDLLVLATGVFRASEGEWADANFKAAHVLRLTTGLLEGETKPLWDDEVGAGHVMYPNRVGLELIFSTTFGGALRGEPALCEALRESSVHRGRPKLVELDEGAAPRVRDRDDESGRVEVVGSYDSLVLGINRREQRIIRDRKFGGRPEVACDLCGGLFPTRLVRAAHIKPRASCNDQDRGNLANVMAACALGCDELFEHGYLSVDSEGTVVADERAVGALLAEVRRAAGRECTAFDPASSGYFAWHRKTWGATA